MKTAVRKASQAGSAAKAGPRFVFHPSFEDSDAEQVYGEAPVAGEESRGFLPDDVTRAWGKRMHYAAWRASRVCTGREEACWLRRYYHCRDRIVLGNQKLTYRAVQKWTAVSARHDDLAGECQIVLIQAVAAFNSWLGIRFSTYAFTCLMRALSRLSQRQTTDRLSRSLPLGALPGGEPCYTMSEQPPGPGTLPLDEYLREGHTLLTQREKAVLLRRYHFNEDLPERTTLEQVGRELGLSKERVRQVQCQALGKLRAALQAEKRVP